MSVTEPSGEPTPDNTTENTSQSENTAQGTEQTSAETQQTTKKIRLSRLRFRAVIRRKQFFRRPEQILCTQHIFVLYPEIIGGLAFVVRRCGDFMGDSRSVGLVAYTGLTNSTTAKDYTKVSLTIFGYDSKAVTTVDGVACTTSQALRKVSFSKVYIAFGMNECGYSKSSFISKYREVIRDIKSINPSAKIYVEDILPVTATKSANFGCVQQPENK